MSTTFTPAFDINRDRAPPRPWAANYGCAGCSAPTAAP